MNTIDPSQLSRWGIDDMDANGNHEDANGNILHNTAIDVQAAYGLQQVQSGDYYDNYNTTFTVYDPAHAPLAIGGLVRGLAVQGSSQPTTQPQPIILGQNEPFNDTVTTVTLPAGADPSALSPLIFWGDGSSSPGTLVSLGNGTYQVKGTHTYEVDGNYIAVVAMGNGNTDPNNPDHEPVIAGVPVFVLPLETTGQLQSIDYSKISVSLAPSDLSQDVNLADGSFTMTLTGSAEFTLEYDLTQPHESSHIVETGSIDFEDNNQMVVTGTYQDQADPSVTLSQESISLTTETINSSISLTHTDASVSFTRMESTSWQLTGSGYRKTADFVAGDYSVGESASLTTSWTDTGGEINPSRLDNNNDNVTIPQNVHDLLGTYTLSETTNETFTRQESGTLGASGATYSRTDVATTSGEFSQTGMNNGLSYTLTASDWQLVDNISVAGTTDGNYTMTETQTYGPDGQQLQEIAQDNEGTSLTIDETDNYNLSRLVSVDLTQHSYSATETSTTDYQAQVNGMSGSDSIDESPADTLSSSSTLTGNEKTGDYQLITHDPSSKQNDPASNEDWSDNITMSVGETGNFISQSMVLNETQSGTITDSLSLTDTPDDSGTIILSSSISEVENGSKTSPSASLTLSSTDTYTDAGIQVQGTVADDPRWSGDASNLIDQFVAGLRQGPGGFLLFKDPIHSSDGTTLPVSASKTIKLPSLSFSDVLAFDPLGNYYSVGFTAGASATVTVGANLPYVALMGNFQGSVQVFAKVGNIFLLGTYLELEAGASFTYSREIDNPQTLQNLAVTIPSALSGGLSQVSNALTYLSNLPSNLQMPPSSLPGTPQGQQINGVSNFETASLPTSIDQSKLASSAEPLARPAAAPSARLPGLRLGHAAVGLQRQLAAHQGHLSFHPELHHRHQARQRPHRRRQQRPGHRGLPPGPIHLFADR